MSPTDQAPLRVSLITGGTRGIGFAIAEALLGQGDAFAITGTSRDGTERAAERLAASNAHDRVLPLVCDVRDLKAMETACETVVGKFGGLDVLINNAGVG